MRDAGFDFGAVPMLRWDEDAMTAQGGGATAEVWRSAVSGKLVLTVVDPTGGRHMGRVLDLTEAREKAEQWLAEAQHSGRRG